MCLRECHIAAPTPTPRPPDPGVLGKRNPAQNPLRLYTIPHVRVQYKHVCKHVCNAIWNTANHNKKSIVALVTCDSQSMGNVLPPHNFPSLLYSLHSEVGTCPESFSRGHEVGHAPLFRLPIQLSQNGLSRFIFVLDRRGVSHHHGILNAITLDTFLLLNP